MNTIRNGSTGNDVKTWQRAIGVHPDGVFGSRTEAATRVWQSAHRLVADGVVGPKTWALVAVNEPFPRPSFSPMSKPERAEVFGSFSWTDSDNNGWIEIQGDWQKRNIVRLEIPELTDEVTGWKGHDFCHRLALAPIQGFFKSVTEAGLIHLVKSWGGCWAPRRIRTLTGFSENLSNHAYGSAFDINVAWNGLGQVPALKGEAGSVIELLPYAYQHGFYWGGLFTSRDGMHFQLDNV